MLPDALPRVTLMTLILLLSAAHVQAEEPARVDVRPYHLRVTAMDKSVRPEQGLQAIAAPVMTTIAPEPAKAQSLSLGDHKGAIEQMLQSHEFSFGKGRSHLKEGGVPPSGMDLDSVKLRISRNKILVKAEFFFN